MPMNKSVYEVVTEYIELERASKDTLTEEHRDALFLSLQGRRMTERQIRELVKKYTSIGMKTSREGGGAFRSRTGYNNTALRCSQKECKKKSCYRYGMGTGKERRK